MKLISNLIIGARKYIPLQAALIFVHIFLIVLSRYCPVYYITQLVCENIINDFHYKRIDTYCCVHPFSLIILIAFIYSPANKYVSLQRGGGGGGRGGGDGRGGGGGNGGERGGGGREEGGGGRGGEGGGG